MPRSGERPKNGSHGGRSEVDRYADRKATLRLRTALAARVEAIARECDHNGLEFEAYLLEMALVQLLSDSNGPSGLKG